MGPWGVFDGWNQLPSLPDRFEPPTDQGEGPRSEYLKKRCWIDTDAIVERLEQLRKDYPKEKLDKIYVSTNENEKWLGQLEKALEAQGGWTSIKSTLHLDTTWEEIGVDNAIGVDRSQLIARLCGMRRTRFGGSRSDGWSAALAFLFFPSCFGHGDN